MNFADTMFFFFYKLKVHGNLASNKSIRPLSNSICSLHVSHILVILTIFQTFSLPLYELWWSIISNVWCYYYKNNSTRWNSWGGQGGALTSGIFYSWIPSSRAPPPLLGQQRNWGWGPGQSPPQECRSKRLQGQAAVNWSPSSHQQQTWIINASKPLFSPLWNGDNNKACGQLLDCVSYPSERGWCSLWE